MNTLFCFAHQDDEYGIFARLHWHCRRGDRVYCAYLTDGGALRQRRRQESLAVLASLGVVQERVSFPGIEYAWQDGHLHAHYADCCRWLAALMDTLEPLGCVYLPAWEGGHPDHDTVHAAAVTVLRQRPRPLPVWQFPLYNGYRCRGPLFRTMLPLPGNGPVVRMPMPLGLRLFYTRLCLRYPSQWKTWLGLFLPVALRYMLTGVQQMQAVPLRRRSRPHPGRLYYERRAFCTWETLKAALEIDPFEVHHD